MSYPTSPPSYDAIYTQDQSQPVQTQPQVAVHVPQPQMVHGSVVIVGSNKVDIAPCVIVCQSCNYTVSTRTEMRPTFRTHAWAVCLFVCGLWPCCFVPYCMPTCNNIDHYCPKCNAYIGSYMS
ncbi:lipopolysaccharide-induced tumor necrosis factor-alpha factor homolog [Anticarsia gemmatalis]|uniref:lipopolysaccharide-induced tumor necrosis factor-alpha factor homolog n=1 Tax=Anticarsia gemmatalis TaxID=129554 RepID=UPI003F76FEA8